MIKKKSDKPRGKSRKTNLEKKKSPEITSETAPETNEKFVSNRQERMHQRAAKKTISQTISPPNHKIHKIQKIQKKKNPPKPDLTINHRTSKSKYSLGRRRKRNAWIVDAIIVAVIVLPTLAYVFRDNFLDKNSNKSDSESSQQSPKASDQSDQEKSPELTPLELARQNAKKNSGAIENILQNSAFSSDNIVKLAVPVYQQTFGQSCEAAALRMALQYRGVETTDLELLEMMNFDDQPAAKTADGKWNWGDPNKTYVGYKDGSQVEMTGYGVYAEPIAAAAETKGRATEIANDVEIAWLARQIYAGNPVVLWGISIKIADVHWTTPDGRVITAPMRTHTRLVVGVKGDPNNPEGFFINDPAVGKMIYWTTAQLAENTAAGIDQAVAVF